MSAVPRMGGEGEGYTAVVDLLGGQGVMGTHIASELDVHKVIKQGLPGGMLENLTARMRVLKPGDVEKAVGISTRTAQRRKGAPDKPLSLEQGGRIWTFAEILTDATEVFGSQEEAEQWLSRPAIGLDGQCPIDLLDTPAGVKMVETYLGRIAFGVYA
jgi:putative toxin-antitoxin system antitoxin component (TIGR02293 family)